MYCPSFFGQIEDPCSKLQKIFDRKECGLFYDSLACPGRKRQGLRSLSQFNII
jgi:hypothetical protein